MSLSYKENADMIFTNQVVVANIFSFLDFVSLKSVMLVNKFFYDIVRNIKKAKFEKKIFCYYHFSNTLTHNYKNTFDESTMIYYLKKSFEPFEIQMRPDIFICIINLRFFKMNTVLKFALTNYFKKINFLINSLIPASNKLFINCAHDNFLIYQEPFINGLFIKNNDKYRFSVNNFNFERFEQLQQVQDFDGLNKFFGGNSTQLIKSIFLIINKETCLIDKFKYILLNVSKNIQNIRSNSDFAFNLSVASNVILDKNNDNICSICCFTTVEATTDCEILQFVLEGRQEEYLYEYSNQEMDDNLNEIILENYDYFNNTISFKEKIKLLNLNKKIKKTSQVFAIENSSFYRESFDQLNSEIFKNEYPGINMITMSSHYQIGNEFGISEQANINSHKRGVLTRMNYFYKYYDTSIITVFILN